MGEVIHGDYGRWANNETLHSVTNYELHKGIFRHIIPIIILRWPIPYAGCMIQIMGCAGMPTCTILSITMMWTAFTTNWKIKKNLFPVYAFLFTTIGIPSVYYGSEWGSRAHKENGSDDGLRPAINLTHGFKRILMQSLKRLDKSWEHIHTGSVRAVGRQQVELFLPTRQYAYAHG